MEIINEYTTRKIDDLGRVGIPKGIRDRMQIRGNDELAVWTLRDNGKEWVCFMNEKQADRIKYGMAASVLEELGLEVPQVICDKLQ